MQTGREEDRYRNRHTWLISKNVEDEEEEEVGCINTYSAFVKFGINSIKLKVLISEKNP
jgi:hypothetical protein